MTISPNWKIDPVTGNLTSPTGKEVDVAAQPTIAADALLVNQSASVGRPTALAVAAQSLILRLAGRIVSFAMATNTVLMRGAADITALAMGAQSVLVRAAGNIIAATIGTDQVVGRSGSGDLGGVKVSPDMQAPVVRMLTTSSSALVASTAFQLVAGQTLGTWPAVASGTRQEVPSAGLYRISVSMFCQFPAVTNPLSIIAELGIGGVWTQWDRNVRYSANASDHLGHKYEVFVRIATPATEYIEVRLNGATSTINGFALIVEKVGA